MTFELGTEFYESCEYFESSIVGINIRALTYAAKTSMAPYSLSKGPDVTSLSANVNGNSLTVAVSASDSAFSSSNHPTSQQGVAEIRVFIDEYPTSGVSGTVVSGSSLTVDISSIAQGRHMVYVQATDNAGYKGPVTSAFFTKQGGGGAITPAPVPPSPVVTPAPAQPTPVIITPTPVQQPTPVPVQPTPVPVQVTSSPVGSSCQDQPNWHDADGADFDCDWYSQGNNCQEYGNDFVNFGATATGACCVCGGGSPGSGGGGGGPTCQDQPNWHDSDGAVYDCVWYAEGNNCATYGNDFSNFGATASQACCVCQTI